MTLAYIRSAAMVNASCKNLDEIGKFKSHPDSDTLTKQKKSIAACIEEKIGKRNIKKIDTSVQYAIYAAESIIQKANIPKSQLQKYGLFIGNNFGGWGYVENQLEGLYNGNFNSINPYVATAWFPTAAQGEISIHNNIEGISKTFSYDALSSAYALEYAINILKHKTLAHALVIGHESLDSDLLTSKLFEDGIVSKDYLPGVGAAGLLITSDNSNLDCPVKIEIMCTTENLEIELQRINEKLVPDYIILSPIAPEKKDIISAEIKLITAILPDSKIIIPTYFLGEIGAACFASQACIAKWMIENNRVPHLEISMPNKLISTKSKNYLNKDVDSVLVVTRDYNNKQHSIMALVRT